MSKSKSLQLFIASLVIIIVSFLIATFWNALGLGDNKMLLAISLMITFGLSIAGIILGINERKITKRKSVIIGLIGNILVILLFIFIIIYSVGSAK